MVVVVSVPPEVVVDGLCVVVVGGAWSGVLFCLVVDAYPSGKYEFVNRDDEHSQCMENMFQTTNQLGFDGFLFESNYPAIPKHHRDVYDSQKHMAGSMLSHGGRNTIFGFGLVRVQTTELLVVKTGVSV